MDKIDSILEKSATDDMMFTVETVSCLGTCGLAPVCTVNDEVYPNMKKAKVKLLVDDIKKDFEAEILTSKEDTSYQD